jgi:hypothetical protein
MRHIGNCHNAPALLLGRAPRVLFPAPRRKSKETGAAGNVKRLTPRVSGRVVGEARALPRGRAICFSKGSHMKLLACFAALFCLGLMARADTFFVAGFGVNTITRYDQNGTPSTFTNAFVNGPNGVALDSAGNLYVSTNSNTIEKFSPAGVDLGVFASNGVNFPMGLAFDSNGNLYAANFAGSTVEKFTPDGVGSVFANIIRPTGLAFDSAGSLYVSNFGNTIEVFSADGLLSSIFANTGLNNPEGLAFDSLGNLYATNNGSDTIEKFSPGGVDLGIFANTGLSGPIGLAFDSSGNLYAVNSRDATIEKFLPNGSAFFFADTGFSPAFLAIQAGSTQTAPMLVNLSTRLRVLMGDNVLDGGFIILGPGSKNLLLRGLGPSLASAGLTGALADPTLELHSGATNAIVAMNDNWKDTQQTAIEATGIPPTIDAEAAIVVTLTEGAYTVIERGKDDTTGVGLVEIYDLDVGTGPELANSSTRGFVDIGSNVMIAGIILAGGAGESSSVIIRALGPSLGDAGVTNPLQDPMLQLRDSDGTLVASNDNWKSDQQAAIEDTGIPPNDDAESAIVATLAPGAYTAIESGKDNGVGVGLVEAYNLH